MARNTQGNGLANIFDDLQNAVVNNESKQSTEWTNESSTKKNIKDILISQIDLYELNEKIFGYNNLEALEASIKNTGTNAIEIHVYEKPDGRYLCYSGNTRLKVLKKMNEKTVTCIIDGPVPDNNELLLNVVSMNTQRVDDPYHVALRLQAVENVLRKRGLSGETLTNELEQRLGYKRSIQFLYKKILSLPGELQPLFSNPEIPFKKLLEIGKKLPGDKVREFVYAYEPYFKEHELTGENIERLFLSIMNQDLQQKDPATKPVRIKFGKTYKNIVNLTCDENGTYLIPKDKKSEYLEQIHLMIDELQKIKAACED